MLRLTREAEYGLLAMAYIAGRPEGELAYRREIAEHHNIPREFLAKVLQKLSREGLIKSYRGIRGGYLLAKVPDEITLADVVRAVDGPMALVECAGKGAGCPQFEVCALREALCDLQQSIVRILQGISLKDLTRRVQRKRSEAAPAPGGAGGATTRGGGSR